MSGARVTFIVTYDPVLTSAEYLSNELIGVEGVEIVAVSPVERLSTNEPSTDEGLVGLNQPGQEVNR